MKKKEYMRPEMQVVEIKTQQILCSSLLLKEDAEYESEYDELL